MDWQNAWLWLAVTLGAFALCTWLPLKIKDDAWRRRVYWFILIPVSLLIIFYIYPAGAEVFRRLAVGQ